MMNFVALCCVVTSLLAAEVWSPSPQKLQNKREDVIVKEGHYSILVETYDDQNGHHSTKVSISPKQPEDPVSTTMDGKFMSGGDMVENVKEKIEEASYVLRDLGQGLDGDGGDPSPRERICDAFGKCTKEFAKDASAIKKEIAHEAKEKVAHAYEKAKDSVSKEAHKAKEEAEYVYGKAKESASEKAHDAKEVARDAFVKAKETVAHKAQDVKENVKETVDKAKGSVKKAKDVAKTMGKDVVVNVSQQVERASETVSKKAKAVRDSTGNATRRVGRLVNHAARYMTSPEALNSATGVVTLLGCATAYGMSAWVTFMSSHVLAGALPRQQFAVVQSKIYPVYFRAMAYSIGAALLGHLLGKGRLLLTSKAEMFQGVNLLASGLLVLINGFYLEPLAAKVMFERMRIEKEEGKGRGSPPAEFRRGEPVGGPAATTTAVEETPAPVSENPEQEEVRSGLVRTSKRLQDLNSYSSFLNLVTLMALTWHLVYLGQCFNASCP